MTQSAENKHLIPRKPVSAVHHERVARSALEFCEEQIRNLQRIVALSATMQRQPAITSDERKNQQTMLCLLTDTAETYLMQAEGSREMFRIISHDACGIPDATISAKSAARLLSPTGKANTDSRASRGTRKAARDTATSSKRVKTATTDAHAIAVQH
jgi:hypothetical protein